MCLRSVVTAALALWMAGCSRALDGPELAREALAAMGGVDRIRAITSLVMTGGEGRRWQTGQPVQVDGADDPGRLTAVTDTLDLANGRAALDYVIQLPDGFTIHRAEVLTTHEGRAVGLQYERDAPPVVMSASGLFGWGTEDSPRTLLRRNVVTVLLQAAEATESSAWQDRELNGRPHKFVTVTLAPGDRVGLYFDAASTLLTALDVNDTDRTLGDVRVRYELGDYRAVDGISLPHTIAVRKANKPYAEVRYASAAIDSAEAMTRLAVPSNAFAEAQRAIAAGEYSPVTLETVADGVLFARAASHNSLVVEFPTFLVVVEAAYTDQQSATLGRALKDSFPDKPIRYAVVTHHHIDHTGGVRGMVAEGATIVTAEGHVPAVRRLLEAKHTRVPDRLEIVRRSQARAGELDVFEYNHTITEGDRSLELYAISGGPHADPVVIAYVPGARVLFQSDLFNPGAPDAPAAPEALHLLESVEELGLRVDLNVGGHAGVAPFADLERAERLLTGGRD